MNILLERNKTTAKKRLAVRTYKIVPLSQRSGILEWCQNTSPIKDYLVGEDYLSGAHKRYQPDDYTARECRQRLGRAQECVRKTGNQGDLLEVSTNICTVSVLYVNLTNNARVFPKAYNEICLRFRPAMRYFFYENFTSPGMHFERRLAYTRSVATNSMIGYILGLGKYEEINLRYQLLRTYHYRLPQVTGTSRTSSSTRQQPSSSTLIWALLSSKASVSQLQRQSRSD